MNWKKPLSFILAATMLAGCSAPSSETGGDTATDGLSVVVQFDADLNTMDHHIATDGNSFIMQSMCFSGLTSLDEAGQPQPELSTSWDVSDDGLTYTFHLAEDATWSDGTPVTANDFVYGWQRLVNPDTASEYAFILDTMHVKNAAAVNAGEMDVSELGVSAPDEHTFEVQLDLPCEFLLGLMAFPSTFPLNQAFYEAHADTYAQSPEDMIYCGPYTMTDWQQGNEYTFTKRDDYFNQDKEAADTVTFKFIQDTQSAMLAYQQGDIDVVKLQSEQVDQYKDSEGFTNRLTGYLWYLSINFTRDTFQNDNLRAAIAYGIDRDTICESVLKDGSVSAEGIVPLELATGPDGKDFRETAGQVVEYDPDKAAEYYAAAVEELGGDVTFDLLFEDSEASKAVAENIQSQLQSACPGLTVNLDSKPKKTRLDLMDTQEYDVCLTRWGPDYADPQTYMDLFTTWNTSSNDGKYSSADYDTLIEAATTGKDATNPEARWQDMIDAEKILVAEDHGVVPVYQNGGAMMINPEIDGIMFHSAGVDDYRHVHAAA